MATKWEVASLVVCSEGCSQQGQHQEVFEKLARNWDCPEGSYQGGLPAKPSEVQSLCVLGVHMPQKRCAKNSVLKIESICIQHSNPTRTETKWQTWEAFSTTMLTCINSDPTFLSMVLFSDEANFHLSGKVNKHNICISGSENPHCTQEHIHDSPKFNVCVMQSQRRYDHWSLLCGETINGII